jgi:hypothetical protein
MRFKDKPKEQRTVQVVVCAKCGDRSQYWYDKDTKTFYLIRGITFRNKDGNYYCERCV